MTQKINNQKRGKGKVNKCNREKSGADFNIRKNIFKGKEKYYGLSIYE